MKRMHALDVGKEKFVWNLLMGCQDKRASYKRKQKNVAEVNTSKVLDTYIREICESLNESCNTY